MIRKIIQIGDKNLLKKSKEIPVEELDSKETKKIIQDLKDTLVHHFESAAGLSAVQIGELKRIFIIKNPDEEGSEEFIVAINPQVKVKNSKETLEWEGCMSISTGKLRLFGPVYRPKEVELSYIDENQKKQKIRLKNFYSHLALHELDHLNGKLFLSYIENPENIWKEDDLDKYLRETGNFPKVVK